MKKHLINPNAISLLTHIVGAPSNRARIDQAHTKEITPRTIKKGEHKMLPFFYYLLTPIGLYIRQLTSS